jgi:hypothetical protein
MAMAETIFSLCALMSALCSWNLCRGYFKTGNRLLLWTGICFAVMAAGNIFLCVDLIVYPDLDMDGPMWRSLLHALSGSLLLGGLILELA